jgi:YD repeat-containing protein
MSTFQLSVIATASVLTAACVGNPARGVPSNQAPLRLVVESGTDNVQVERAAGNTYDADGNLVAQRTEFATEQVEWNDYSYYQGAEKLDEQDFYRLSLDQRAYDEIVDARAKAHKQQMFGLPMALVGVAGATAAPLIFEDRSSPAAITTTIASSLVGAAGAYLYVKGTTTMRNKHLLPAERAAEVAEVVESCRSGRCVTVKSRPRSHPTTGALDRPLSP